MQLPPQLSAQYVKSDTFLMVEFLNLSMDSGTSVLDKPRIGLHY